MTPNRLRGMLMGWFLLALLAGSATPVTAENSSSAPIDPRVRSLLAQDGAADVLILLGSQPDLSAAYSLPDKTARGRWVARTLRAAAERSQKPLWHDAIHGVCAGLYPCCDRTCASNRPAKACG